MNAAEMLAEHGDMVRGLRDRGLGRRKIAEELTRILGQHVSPGVVRRALDRIGQPRLPDRVANLEIEDTSLIHPADGEVPIEELIRHKIKIAERKRIKSSAHARTLTLPAEPVGLLILGDPHVDNNGCDWGLLMQHVEIARSTPGVLTSCVGDMTDNWIGRLQRLYSDTEISAHDGWRLSKWLLEQVQWLALVGGNHDKWAHSPGVNPLGWISDIAKVQCFADDEIRMSLRWRGRDDLEPFEWVLRHDFPGRSMYHPTHAPHREAIFDGRAHLFTAGHIHQWGTVETEQRHGRCTVALRVRGYKRDDEHARSLGFYEQVHGAACLVVLDPTVRGPGRQSVHWDIERGADYLTWLRGR